VKVRILQCCAEVLRLKAFMICSLWYINPEVSVRDKFSTQWLSEKKAAFCPHQGNRHPPGSEEKS
jgi:hypothetical protein